ncbi:MAG TPA: group I intron-associated PD-(D/E)XK endonuclease [Candidatus Sulfotelmatobacter sp.]
MSAFIGDLMAVADEDYGEGGERKKSGKRKGKVGPHDREDRRPGRKRTGDARVCGDPVRSIAGADKSEGPSASTERGPQDDKASSGGTTKLIGTKKKFPPKQMGELWELDFLRKALGMGMIVSKPWGDSYRYDFVVDTAGKLWRVQVRATESRFGARGYAVHASVYKGRKIVGLTKKDIDVIVAYIANRNIWYVVPVQAFVPRKNLWFYPDGSKKGAMFEKFRDAWWVMTRERRKR